MDAEITGESERVGLSVIDNAEVEHLIEMDESGEIKYHEQDGYSDYPSERTQAENEHVHQARRYAKWYVYRERGYDTLDRLANPDSLVGAIIALSEASEAEITDRFGPLRDQLKSHYDGATVELPFEDADPSEILIYRQDIYLDGDPTEVDPPLVDQYGAFAEEVQDTTQSALADADNLEGWLASMFNERERINDILPSFDIEAVSDLHYYHSDGVNEQEEWAEAPLDREPDIRLELPPLDPDTFDVYQLLLISHLSNQIRDRYLMMGLEPPEVFQQQGFGTYRGAIKQNLNDMYDKYYLASDPVDSWRPANG